MARLRHAHSHTYTTDYRTATETTERKFGVNGFGVIGLACTMYNVVLVRNTFKTNKNWGTAEI